MPLRRAHSQTRSAAAQRHAICARAPFQLPTTGAVHADAISAMAPVTSMLDHFMKFNVLAMAALILTGCTQDRNNYRSNAMKLEISNDQLAITIVAAKPIYIAGNAFYGRITYDIKTNDSKVGKAVATWKIPCYYAGNIYVIHPGNKEQYAIGLKGYAGGEITVLYNYYNNEVDLRKSESCSILTASITRRLTSR